MTVYSSFYRKVLWPLFEKKNGIITRHHLNFLNKSQLWTREELDNFKWQRIKTLLHHAYENSIFYKKRFEELKLHPNDFKNLKDLEYLPPISRNDLNNHLETMIAGGIKNKYIHFSTTGGSTGLPTRFARDNACLSIKNASEFRFNIWAGWKPGDKILHYWPALMDFSGEMNSYTVLKSILFNRKLRLYAGQLNKDILLKHLKFYKLYRPQLIRAFPSALERFAEFIIDSGRKIPKPRGIISVGEPLLESQRRLFENTFGCEIFNCYVSRECGNIASECQNHDGLHVAEELIHLEINKQDKGEYGEILLTDLWNMGMPFIRYRIQDAARFVKGTCLCGKNHMRIGVDSARISDFLISPIDGSFISGSTLLHYLLAEGPNVGRVKLIQETPKHIKVLISGNKNAQVDSMKHIELRLNTIFKGSILVDFEFVESIPLLKSGKYRFVERRFK